MDSMVIISAGLPISIFIMVVISFYKVFLKKKSVTPFYTPFDEIMGQSQVEFHVEQEILAVDEEQGDDFNKVCNK
ncbi:DUF3951 domain-containing protein [Pseudoneobacillus rhizosphaerae]|uniref:DUF3951 domain-containing protein n=1 Tax=Pseudoneobacillus rhizosphaerae TaxID=2880968 RepID=A0A9C7LCY2_9BACI|nr:DUF3951 domain-containing protein [Pseudoneobacillus rhizosphaerae]CAG9610623.1 hypothetical protein NEOCIP111885_04398 [Pseudoneobacillus rhizosphaerae]